MDRVDTFKEINSLQMDSNNRWLDRPRFRRVDRVDTLALFCFIANNLKL